MDWMVIIEYEWLLEGVRDYYTFRVLKLMYECNKVCTRGNGRLLEGVKDY